MSDKLTKSEIIQELQDQSNSINGVMTVRDEENTTLVSIVNDNGEYRVRINEDDDYMNLMKLTNTGAGDGVSGELNEDIMTQIIQDIDEAEDQPDDSDDEDETEE